MGKPRHRPALGALSADDLDRVALLNAMIAEESAALECAVEQLRDLATRIPDPPRRRLTSQEKGGGFGDGGWHGVVDIKRVHDLAAEAAAIEARIGDLTRRKLRLLDDGDFGGGDDLRGRIEAEKALLRP